MGKKEFEDDDVFEEDDDFEEGEDYEEEFDDDDDDDGDYEFDDDDDDDDDNYHAINIEEAEGFQVVTVVDRRNHLLHVDVIPSEFEEQVNLQTDIAQLIDSTLLKPDATKQQIIDLCVEAIECNFGAVCVNSCWVRLCNEILRGTHVRIASVIGFPLGAMATGAKVAETMCAIDDGASEIDMVINVGELKSKNYEKVARDIKLVAEVVHDHGALLKVIIETCLLTKDEKVIACLLAKSADADFVKTSTGFSTAGATVEDVELMRSVVGDDMGVKAAGGIRSFEDFDKMINAGASRIGTSSGKKILDGSK